MPPMTTKAVYFGSYLVTTQVFHVTQLSFALVNLKPILPGHVLICPLRRIPRFNDLSPAEVTDLFSTVQRVSRMLERVFKASALNIAIQDGEDAGQSVPHVHVHILPRQKADLDRKGGPDVVYKMMDGEEGDIGGHLDEQRQGKPRESMRRGALPAVDTDEHRIPRSEEEMGQEAEWLSQEMAKDAARSRPDS